MKIGKERAVVFLLTIGFLFCTLSPLQAIDIQWGMFMNLGIPTGPFQKNIGKNLYGPGFIMVLSIRPASLPLFLGGRILWNTYGQDSRQESVFVPEFGDVDFKVNHSYDLIRAEIFIRWQAFPNNVLQPYLELSAGFVNPSGQVSIPANYGDSEGDDTLDSRLLISDTQFSYGGGAGLLIRLAKETAKNQKHVTSHFLELGVDYCSSASSLDYMRKGSVVITDGTVEKIIHRSRITMFTAFLGYSVRF